ncbi:MAG: LamG domain-containing protein [Chloroflexi bacterium]|nr:LamG domain-containing protein [Chloroflexota bacterium]
MRPTDIGGGGYGQQRGATLGSVSLNVTTPGTSNQTFTSGGNSIILNWTVDNTPIYQPNPAPGTSGRIANGALFDGTGIVTVTDATVPLNLIDDFTIAAWIKTTAVNSGILVKTDGDTTWEQGEKAFYLNSTGQPTFVGFGNNYIRSNTAVNDGYWHYVVVVWDYSGSGTTGTGKIYIDGVDATGTVNYRTNNADVAGHTLKIGGTNNNTNEARYIFDGQIDELAAYRRALSEAELYSIYLREIRWYRDQATSYITVDTDNPTVELLSDGAYWADGYIQLAVATTDATSSVALVDFGLKGPGASSYTWMGAQQCQDNGVDGAAWCPSFDSSVLGGEGKYELQFRVVDAVGNETTSQVYTLYVDGTSPTASGSFTGQWGTFVAQDDERLNWTVNLSGTLSDPNLNTTPVVAGSGVVTNTVLVELLDSANGLISEGEQQATVTGSSWSVNYKLEGSRPQGTYSVRITLADNVGNVSLMTLGTVRFDERPPKATFNQWEVNSEVISSTLTLRGNVSDQADWAGEAAHYAFEAEQGSPVSVTAGEWRSRELHQLSGAGQ